MEKTMFDIQTQLFEGRDIRFGPIDHEKDPQIESKWMHDSDFMRLYQIDPARPMLAAMLKKKYEKLEKEIEKSKNIFYFDIRSYEKAGFRHEGRMRGTLNKEGRRWDILVMGILREEWMEQNGYKTAN